ncbi:MAG: hypothetical protein ACLFV7_05890 [Phycisphaerae bacterium]
MFSLHRFLPLAAVLLLLATVPAQADDDFDRGVQEIVADAEDDTQRARKLLDAARFLDTKKAYQVRLLERAVEYGMDRPVRSERVLRDVLGLLDKLAPGRADEWAAIRVKLLRSAYNKGNRGKQMRLSDQLVKMLVEQGRLCLRVGKFKEAREAYHDAWAIGNSHAHRQTDNLMALRLRALYMDKAATRLEGITALLERSPENDSVRQKVIETLVIDFNNPRKASEYVNASTPPEYRTYLPMARKDPSKLDKNACFELGRWYKSLAESAEEPVRIRMVKRSLQYFQRFEKLHAKKDLAMLKVAQAMKELEGAIEELDIPAIKSDGWVNMLGWVDISDNTVNGKWRWGMKGLYTSGALQRGIICCPVKPSGSYRVEVKFSRTAGASTVGLVIPVGEHHGMIHLCHKNQASGLECIGEFGGGLYSNPTLTKEVKIVNRRDYTLIAEVKIDGTTAHITAALNGKQFLDWKGAPSELRLHSNWAQATKGMPALCVEQSGATFYGGYIKAINGKIEVQE